jgi:hypothetical protein
MVFAIDDTAAADVAADVAEAIHEVDKAMLTSA